MTASRLEVGRIGRAHGLSGELAVTFTSDREERLIPGSVLYAEERRLVVTASRPHQHRWLVTFEAVSDRNAAEALLGVVLTADPMPTTDDGELWIHDLVGSEVRDPAGLRLGEVIAIEANPASDLLVLDGDRLVPLTFLVDRAPGVLVVDVPAGLLD